MSTTEGQNCILEGRIVWTVAGHPIKGKAKVDDTTGQPKVGKDGNQMYEYGFGLAVPKNKIEEIWRIMHEEAFKIYPQGLPPDFAMKYKDGDTDMDPNGKPYSEREGHKGSLVFQLTGGMPITFFDMNNTMISDGVKCGDWVQVQVKVKAHGPVGRGKPGLYLNPSLVRVIGYDTEIKNVVNPQSVFGQMPEVPPGASSTPVAPATAFPGQPQQAPQQAPAAQGMPQAPGGFPAPPSANGQ